MITQCRSCGSTKLADILTLGNQYLSDFVDKGVDKKPESYPLDLVMCRECTLLQLKETTPSSSLYNDHYGYRSGINQTMREELALIVREASKRVDLQSGDIVVDIGSNDGTLLSNYLNGIIRVGFEPVSKLAFDCEKHAETVINEFFSREAYVFSQRAKIITAISMFYDLDNPNKFVSDMVDILDPEGIIVIQQNYLVGMLEQHAFDNIVHEHLEYYSLTSLEKLLNRHGLEVFDVETSSINGGSFRTYVRHMDALKKMRYMERKLKLDNEWTYMLFALEVKKLTKKLHNFIEGEVKKGKTVYIYGASTRGNTLIQAAGLDNKLIKAAVERNPEKWGKKIASVDIPIISEEQARKEKPDYFLVLPWFFRSEIIKRESEFIKQGGKLIFPLPKMEVIGD